MILSMTGFGRTGRNIIFINQKKDDKPKMARDKFARPQLFLEISGTNETQLIETLKKAASFSINEFQKGEIEENKRRILKSPLNKTNLNFLKDAHKLFLQLSFHFSLQYETL